MMLPSCGLRRDPLLRNGRDASRQLWLLLPQLHSLLEHTGGGSSVAAKTFITIENKWVGRAPWGADFLEVYGIPGVHEVGNPLAGALRIK